MKQKITAAFSALLLVILSGRARCQWTQARGPYGGLIECMAGDPGGTYVGAYGAGIFKSTDNGKSWLQQNIGISNPNFVCMAKTRRCILAATDKKLMISSDGGTTWQSPESSLPDSPVYSMAVSGYTVFAGGERGFFISTDNGFNWFAADSGLPANPSVQSIAISDTSLYAAVTGYGVFKSSVNHIVWVEANSVGPLDYTRDLFTGDSLLLAMTDYGICRSTDGGQTWDTTSSLHRIINCFAHIGRFNFVGTDSGIYESSDKGVNWEAVNVPLFSPNVLSMAFVGNDLFAGSESGICVSSDTGTTWAKADSGLSATSVGSLAGTFYEVYAGTYGGGVYVSGDGGQSWFNAGLPYGRVYNLASDGSQIFAGATYGSGLYFTSSESSNWTRVSATELGSGVSALGFIGDRLFAVKAYAGKMFSTTDGGINWSEADSGATYNVSSFTSLGKRIFAGSYGGGVFESADSGVSWRATNSGLTNLTVPCIVAADTKLVAGTGDGVFVSSDSGASWIMPDSSLQDDTVQCLIAFGGAVLAGTHGHGIFASGDFGMSWHPFNQGLTDSSVNSISINLGGVTPNYTPNVILIGTNSGVWSRPLSQLIPDEVKMDETLPMKFQLNQNYPNPFNPTTMINYQLPMISHVTLKLYDVLGREVATIVDEVEKPGRYEIRFDGSRLASGVYFYRLVAGEQSTVRKMMLLK